MIKIDYDVIVIGAGPGGYTAAIRCAQLGKKVCIIEREKLGGTCTNWGCIPTKAMIASVDMGAKLKKAKRYGIDVDGFSFDFLRIMKRKDTVIRASVLGIKGLLESNDVDIKTGEAKILSKSEIQCKDEVISFDNIIVATGSKPFLLPGVVPDGDILLTSRDLLDLKEIPKSLIIIGGGVIGVEFATIFSILGTDVTIVEMMDDLISMQDRSVIDEYRKHIEKLGVKVLCGHKFMSIEGNTVNAHDMSSDKDVTLDAEKILFAIGRKANFDPDELDGVGILHDRKGIIVDDNMRTNLENVYAVGDVNGKVQLAHVASAQGIVAAENICGMEKKMDHSVVPACIFTIPEMSSVGLKESETDDAKIGMFPFIANGKARASGDKDGFVKVIVSENKLVGAHIIGAHASDLIEEAALAIKAGVNVEEIIDTIHPHPSLCEAFKGAIEDAMGHAIDLPKKG